MRTWFSLVPCAAVSLAILSAPASAQQRSAQECQGEWRANAATFRQQGVSQTAYVSLCKDGLVVQPPSAPSASSAPEPSGAQSPPPRSAAATPSVKACQAEWRTNRAIYQAAKITQAAYIRMCQDGTAPSVANPQTQQSSPFANNY
jgi:hypothetical protein